MTKRLGAIALGIGLAATPAFAQTAAGVLRYQNTTPQQVANLPFLIQYQFGIGAIPNGQCPHVFINGTEIPSTINVKSSYDQIDNSIRHVNMQYKIPTIPPAAVPAQDGVGLVLATFQPGDCSNQGQTEKDYPVDPANPVNPVNTMAMNMCLPYMFFGTKIAGSPTIWLTAPDWHDLPGHPPTFADAHRSANCLTGAPVR